MAASPRGGKQQSGTVGCREYSLITFVSSNRRRSRGSSARAGPRRHADLRAKERSGNAGSWRASERLTPKDTDVSLVM
jgi:hypothetical protein